MNHIFPKLISECSEHNKFDLSTFLNTGIPWLRLPSIKVPEFDQSYLDNIVKNSIDWRNQWAFNDIGESADYQVNGWNGSFYFGIADTDRLKALKKYKDSNFINDEDRFCLLHRKEFKFEWKVPDDDPIRKFVTSIFNNDIDINIVNTYVLPAGGYLFPHLDGCVDHKGLNKLYIPLQWDNGNEFGFYNLGNMPVKNRNVYLINNYKYVHWVVNKSNRPRVVLDIGANLSAIKDIIEDSFYSI